MPGYNSAKKIAAGLVAVGSLATTVSACKPGSANLEEHLVAADSITAPAVSAGPPLDREFDNYASLELAMNDAGYEFLANVDPSVEYRPVGGVFEAFEIPPKSNVELEREYAADGADVRVRNEAFGKWGTQHYGLRSVWKKVPEGQEPRRGFFSGADVGTGADIDDSPMDYLP